MRVRQPDSKLDAVAAKDDGVVQPLIFPTAIEPTGQLQGDAGVIVELESRQIQVGDIDKNLEAKAVVIVSCEAVEDVSLKAALPIALIRLHTHASEASNFRVGEAGKVMDGKVTCPAVALTKGMTCCLSIGKKATPPIAFECAVLSVKSRTTVPCGQTLTENMSVKSSDFKSYQNP